MKKTTQYMKYIWKEPDNEEEMLLRIACLLIRYRGENNMTQKELADRVGISTTMICRLESGGYSPNIKQLMQISERIGWDFKLKFGPSQ